MPSRPRSSKKLTARSMTGSPASPPWTRMTRPVDFSVTNRSSAPMTAMDVGSTSPSTTSSTPRASSVMAGPVGAGSADGDAWADGSGVGDPVGSPEAPSSGGPKLQAALGSVLVPQAATTRVRARRATPKRRAGAVGVGFGIDPRWQPRPRSRPALHREHLQCRRSFARRMSDARRDATPPRSLVGSYAGGTFWLRWNRLAASTRALIAARRSQVAPG